MLLHHQPMQGFIFWMACIFLVSCTLYAYSTNSFVYLFHECSENSPAQRQKNKCRWLETNEEHMKYESTYTVTKCLQNNKGQPKNFNRNHYFVHSMIAVYDAQNSSTKSTCLNIDTSRTLADAFLILSLCWETTSCL